MSNRSTLNIDASLFVPDRNRALDSSRSRRDRFLSVQRLSMNLAMVRSLSDTPPTSWVVRVTSTRLYTLNHSGWWSLLSASKATRVIQPKACKRYYIKLQVQKELFERSSSLGPATDSSPLKAGPFWAHTMKKIENSLYPYMYIYHQNGSSDDQSR